MSVTSIHQCKNIKALLEYCITPKKEQERERVAKLYCDLGNADQFLNYALDTVKAYKRKVQGFSILQSFPKHEMSVSNEEHIAYANELGRKLAHELYPNSPCIVITHADSEGECVHNHIIVLNHDLQTNKCIKANRHYKYVKQANDRLMKKYGFEVCKPSMQKQSQGEYWSNKRNGWLDDLKASVDKALSNATTIQEFYNYLLAEGVSATLYKANGALKEHFTYKVMDNDGKEHKKRSDRLGEGYTRRAIEKMLLANRQKKQQASVLPMSEWIEIQKNQKKKQIQPKKVEQVQVSVLPVITQPINKPNDERKEGKEEMQKEILVKEKLSVMDEKEKEYQELLKERVRLETQLKQLRKITEKGDFMDENDKQLDLVQKELTLLNDRIKRLGVANAPKVRLNESLMPHVPSLSKDRSMSM